MGKKKQFLRYCLLTVFSVAFIFFGNRVAAKDALMFTNQVGEYTHRYIVRVDAILDTQVSTVDYAGGFETTKIKFSGSVVFGAERGKTIIATQTFDGMTTPYPTPVCVGNWIFVYLNANVSQDYFAGNLFRINKIAVTALVFFALLVLFARAKGFTTILALVFSVMSVFLIFIPAILAGRNAYFWAILICLFTIVIMPFYVGGFNRKSMASALGCIGGVTIAGVLTYFMNIWIRITGAIDEETMYVSFINPDKPIDLRAIVFAGILIGALGATVDVSMSIATSMNEMNETGERSTFGALLSSGLNIGRDILGAQISTLVLAYIGGAMTLTLLLFAYQPSVSEMLNREVVVIELLQMLIGGFVILFTIPATALVCALLYEKKSQDGGGRRKTYRSGKKRKGTTYKIGH